MKALFKQHIRKTPGVFLKLIVSFFVLSACVSAETPKVDELQIELTESMQLLLDVETADVTVAGNEASNVTVVANESFINAFVVTKNETGVALSFKENVDKEIIQVYVPKATLLNVKSKSGDITLRHLTGDITAHSVDGTVEGGMLGGDHTLSSVNGNVVLKESMGKHVLESINGKIVIEDVKGVLSVKNVSGEIALQSSLASLNASNMKGDIQGRLDSVEKIALSTVNGNVNLQLHPRESASISIETVSGNVTLGVEETISASFNLAVHQNGSIKNAFSPSVDESEGNDKKSVFKLGEGSASIDVSTLNGNIEIEKLQQETQAQAPSDGDGQFDWSSVDQSKLQFAFVKPEVDFASYKHVYISKVKIEFDEQWVRQFGSSGYSKYIERVEARYAERFRDILIKGIEDNTRWKVVSERKKDALIILPKVTDLYINTPEEIGMRDTVITVGGRAALDLTVYSPRDKAVWALFVDKRNSARLSSAESTMRTRVANEKSFTKLFDAWVETIMEYVSAE